MGGAGRAASARPATLVRQWSSGPVRPIFDWACRATRMPDLLDWEHVAPCGVVRKQCCIAGLTALGPVHFFRGPLKELANAISGSPQPAAKS